MGSNMWNVDAGTSPPTRGRELKWIAMCSCIWTMKSPPTRGRELK